MPILLFWNTFLVKILFHQLQAHLRDLGNYKLYSKDNGLILRTGSSENPNGVIKFLTGNLPSENSSLERMRIDSNGNIGFGTPNPKSKVQVTDGDVYIDNPSRGIILKSPNGTCWRVTIDDLGNFVRTSIVCP